MDTLKWLFFESTPALGGCLAVVLFLLLVHWRRTLKPRAFLTGLAVAAILLIVQAIVVTHGEHASRIMATIELEVLASRPDGLAPFLSERFYIEDADWDRAEFLQRVRDYMERVDVRTLTRRKLEVEKNDGEQFQIYISYLADINTQDFDRPVLSRWRITFVHEANHWRILTIIPVSIDQTPTGGWRGVPRP